MDRTNPDPTTGVERPIMAIKEDGLLARAFRWSWGVNDVSNFCLLFWGTVFMPLGIFLNYVAAPVVGRLLEWHDRRRFHRGVSKMIEEDGEDDEPETTQEEESINFLVSVHVFFIRVWRVITKPRWLWVGAGVVLVLAALAALGYFFYVLVDTWDWTVFLHVLLTVGIIAGTLGVVVGLIFVRIVLDEKPKVRYRIWQAITFPFRFVYHGLLTVKHATCPVVEIKSSKEATDA